MKSYFKDYQEHKIPHTLGDFDKNGIPLFDPKLFKLKGGSSYHPIVIVQYALASYNLWKENDNKEHKDSFLKCAKWLVSNYTYHKDNNLAIYYYDFDLKNPPVKAPWYSGMAQGQILSLFARVYYETNEDIYINVGKKIINSFKTSIEQKGCNSQLDGYIFIQEIASSPKLYILNGALYAIIGLLEFNNVTDDTHIINIDKFIIGLEGLLPRFDMGFWTKYSLGMRFNLATKYYQNVHSQQLIFLGKELNNSFLLGYGIKFQKQLNNNARLATVIYHISLTINRVIRVLRLNSILFKKLDEKR